MSMSGNDDRLWVPALTHYRRENAQIVLDETRMLAHIGAMQPAVRQLLLAGSTGDGWEMHSADLENLIRLTHDRSRFDDDVRFLVGALRPTTEEVVERAVAIERWVAGRPNGNEGFVGLAICPPIAKDADQATIRAHYEAVLQATRCPVAVYQLPQITGCRIDHATLQQLAANPRITMFKDTSGEDTVANAGRLGSVTFVRGAEGKYLEALMPKGPYDGWLLSTGNVFGGLLRSMLDLHERGELKVASRLSNVMSELVAGLFDAAAELPFGNAFSNANRAADHLIAFGSSWRDRPRPLTISGNELPDRLLETAYELLGKLPSVGTAGYML